MKLRLSGIKKLHINNKSLVFLVFLIAGILFGMHNSLNFFHSRNAGIASGDTITKQQNKALEDYRKTIASGDNYFKAKDYLNAKNAYQYALDLKPDDPYAKDKLKQTMELIRSQKAQNTLYDLAIASAEKLFQAKEYEKAKTEFEKASKILPGDKYAMDRINEIIKILVDQATTDEMYASAIAAGDKFFNEKNYRGALKQYQDASVYKPEEKYPKDRIAEVTELIKVQKARDDAYNKAIAAADNFFTGSSYDNAKKEYRNALVIKPEETYPAGRIKEIEDILAGRQKISEQYNRLVNAGDSLYIEKKFIAARANYQQALKLKPGESYPKDMISKADKMIAGQIADEQAAEEAYKVSVSTADEFFNARYYDQAKAEYQNASSIKPSESYPRTRITEIDKILADIAKLKSLDEQYDGLIAEADKSFADKAYAEARTGYQSALKIRPDQKYPKDKISEIDNALAEITKLKELADKYSASIAKADKLFNDKMLDLSKAEYAAAGNLRPDENYPKQKIAEIDKLLADAAAMKAAEDEYRAIVINADKLLTAKKYTEAKGEYNRALTERPEDEYPRKRIIEIDNYFAEVAAAKEKEAQYNDAIEKADRLLAEKSYELAKAGYQGAAQIKPDETYPRTKISLIDNILAEIAKQKSLDEQYAGLISAADRQLAAKSYAEARSGYQEALKIKPDQQYPKDKTGEIDAALAEVARLKGINDQYASSITKADMLFADKSLELAKSEYANASSIKPEESYPKDKIKEIDKLFADAKARDDQYQSLVEKADKLLEGKNYEQAKTEYQDALTIKPDETYPKIKIGEIDQALAGIARQKALDDQYEGLISSSDKLLAEKSYIEAKSGYQKALDLKPDQQYPKDKIGEIDIALAELAKLKALDDRYNEAIAKADQYLSGQKLELAKTVYTDALTLKPSESYPKQKISEIDKMLADIAAQKALDEKYQSVIANADNLLAAKEYSNAKNEYANASGLKPGEQYPKDKITEIDQVLAAIAEAKAKDEQYKSAIDRADKLLAAKSYDQAKSEYQNALAIKAEEEYPKSKIAEIDLQLEAIAKQKALDERYSGLIAEGDKKFTDKSYEEARTAYQSASELKPDQQYPKSKIAEIDKTLSDIARQKALDEQYNAFISKADKLLADNMLDESRTEYIAAGNLKPGESYPKEKIAEIERLKVKAAQQKILDDKYNAAIENADRLLAGRDYNNAKTGYANASQLKPDEKYPKEKIEEIDAVLGELRAKDEQYKASIVKADQLLLQKSYEEARSEYSNASLVKPSEDYPKNKIDEINNILMELKGKKQTFDDLVAKGDNFFSQKDYYRAQDNFKQASSIFPEEMYPKQRLTRINSIIDSIYRANKGKYDKAIADGDRAFNSLIYDNALDFYGEALTYLPMENYPKEMIRKIKKAISENAIVDVLNIPVAISEGTEKQFPFEPVNIASRKNNYLYIKIRNLTDKPFNVLIRYGKDNQTYGGAVIRNLQGDGNTYDRLISVRSQDPWYREDNNWLSLLPQGGDVEVSFIQISRTVQ